MANIDNLSTNYIEKNNVSGFQTSNLANSTDTLAQNSIFYSEELNNSDGSNISSLNEQFENVKKEQGFIGKLWDGFKNFTGLGLSSNDIKDEIALYEKGEKTYEEVQSSIESFENKQDGMVDIVANMASGVISAGVAIGTGGAGIEIAALASGAIKAGIKTADRATNEVEGDAIDAKQILKDGCTGAIDGAISFATAGMIKAPVMGQSVSEAVKQGVIQGAKAGAISGAVTGAGNYAVEAAFEEDVDFDMADFVKSSAQNALAGGVMGGLMGGVTSGIQQSGLNAKCAKYRQDGREYLENYNEMQIKKGKTPLTEEQMQIYEDKIYQARLNAEKMNEMYNSELGYARSEIDQTFTDKSFKLTYRIKSEESITNKLAKKIISDDLDPNDMDACYKAINDAIGSRVQINGLDELENVSAKAIVERQGVSYDDFVAYMTEADDLGINGANSSIRTRSDLSDETIRSIENVKDDILKSLKTAQTENVVKQLKEGIENGTITITELSNYGDELTSYFTKEQLNEIVDSYAIAMEKNPNLKPLKITTKEMPDVVSGVESKITNPGYGDDVTEITVSKDSNGDIVYKKSDKVVATARSKNATKNSGYATTQMDVKHKISDTTTANGELQIRGTSLNNFADVEHIPYDIKSGKITANNKNYKSVYDIISKMDDDTYSGYSVYIKKMYEYYRKSELGIASSYKPKLSDFIKEGSLTDEAISAINADGLLETAQKAKK